MKKRHIIFVQNVEYPQQWAIDIFYYAKYLSAYDNIKVSVIISKNKYNIWNKNLKIYELWKINYILFIFRSYFTVKNINKNESIDYVYFFAQHPLSVLLQFFVSYTLKIKTIYDVVSGPIWKWLSSWISKKTIQLWVFLSERYVVLDYWLITRLQLTIKKPYEIIWMWYDESLFFENKTASLFDSKDKWITFCYIWTLDARRELHIFIQAFIQNLLIYPSINLYFIWSGNDEQNLKNISKKYLNKNIFFLGLIEHKNIPDYINSADILVSYIPQKDYFDFQAPTKLIEYLACNKVVIATKTSAQKVILWIHEELLHNDDVSSTAWMIRKCIENNNSFQSKNYISLVNGLSWKELLEKMKKFID